jgi:hypothetical protein
MARFRRTAFIGGAMRLTRAVVICLLALNGVLQGAALAALHCRSSSEPGAAIACSGAGAGSGSGHERASVAGCLLCSVQAQAASWSLPPRLEPILVHRPASSASRGHEIENLASPPVGWASAWSSRAPPLVS